MGTSNPLIIYYDVMLVLSVLLTGIYIFRWQKHYDVHITLVFVLVPVINLAYTLLAHARTEEEALVADKLTFLSGSFLELILVLVVFSLCRIRLNRFVKILFFVFSTLVFLAANGIGTSTQFYTRISMVMQNGVPVFEKEYGWIHTVFRGMVIFYFALSLAVIIYALIRKNQVSRKILVMLFLPEALAFVAFFASRSWTPGIELIPAVYVIAQVIYLFIAARISLYDPADTAIDSLVQKGETGFISIDYHYRYLGSNETARRVFPALSDLTVDLSVKRSRSFSSLVIPWLEAYREDGKQNTRHYEAEDIIYMVQISPLVNNGRKKGYQLTLIDDTMDQKYIRLLHNYSEELQDKVAEKTAHLEEMHDKLILGLATMVESRDNSTGGHIRRTSEGVRILLDEMREEDMPELTESFRRQLIKAAPMHDLGKIAVPDKILQKPGRFEPEEFEKMKTHAPEGARIVHEILKGTDDVEFHHIAENVAHYHHERWDGSGYPEGLKGEEIPLEARIMAVADVYDALVSKRVYKEKMSFEKADRIMREGMGSQFAPEMEEVYLRARPRLEAYYSSLE